MKKFLIVMVFIFIESPAWSQNYTVLGDSCFKAQNYLEAAKNYDLFLAKVESHSNQIAYKAARSWAMTRNLERTLTALDKYVDNNYINDYYQFSKDLVTDSVFQFLRDEPRWKIMLKKVIEKEKLYNKIEQSKIDSILLFQKALDRQSSQRRIKFAEGTGKRAYEQLKKFNNYPKIDAQTISLQFKINDSLHSSFLVVLPKNYNEKNRYPLLFFLHGAVRMNTGFPTYSDSRDTSGWNRYYTKYASKHNVIMVYPNGNREYNWMTPDKGFYMIPAILQQIKKVINVADNKVFISGHSNGATGSFSYAIKQPSPFAGFYGFNTRPQVATGGTFLRNLLNRSFFNISTDEDYYYPPNANDSLTNLMQKLGADYQDHRYNGFPHWFPAFNASEPAFKLLFDDLISRTRNPFKSALQWECDDVKYGRCDWIEIKSIDTLADKREWPNPLNFKINKWIVLDKDDEPVLRDTIMNAYSYKKRSGAIRATYSHNTFKIESAGVKSIRLYISPEMVNMKNEVTVWYNGSIKYKGKVVFNREFILKEFEKSTEREAVWVNYIDIIL